jgi:hypothetical protein
VPAFCEGVVDQVVAVEVEQVEAHERDACATAPACERVEVLGSIGT